MRIGLWYMVLAAFFFSIMSVLVKIGGQTLPSQELVLARAVVTLVLSWFLLRQRRISPWGKNTKLLLARGGAGFIALSCFYYSVTHLPLADATVIQYTNPVFTAVLAAVFLKESFGVRDAIGGLVSLVGVVMIARPTFIFAREQSLDSTAVAIAITGSVVSAVAYTLVRELRKTDDPLVVVFYFPLIAVPGSLATVWPVFEMPTGWEWVLLLAIGVVTQIAQVYMTKGLHLEKASTATSISYLQIAFAFAWGLMLFDESPAASSYWGTGLVVGGTLFISMARRARGPNDPPSPDEADLPSHRERSSPPR